MQRLELDLTPLDDHKSISPLSCVVCTHCGGRDVNGADVEQWREPATQQGEPGEIVH